jgi:hypothetical protein
MTSLWVTCMRRCTPAAEMTVQMYCPSVARLWVSSNDFDAPAGAVLQCQQGVQGTAAGAAAGGGGGAVADEPRPQPRGAVVDRAPRRRRQSLSVGAAQRLDTQGLACRQQQGSMCRPLAASITEAPGGVMQPAGLSWCVYRVCITPMAIRMDRLLMGGLDSYKKRTCGTDRTYASCCWALLKCQ